MLTQKTILQLLVLASISILPACHFSIETIVGPPCYSCSDDSFGSSSDNSDWDSGSSSSRDSANPPRYNGEVNPGRIAEDRDNREKERAGRPPTKLEFATVHVLSLIHI